MESVKPGPREQGTEVEEKKGEVPPGCPREWAVVWEEESKMKGRVGEVQPVLQASSNWLKNACFPGSQTFPEDLRSLG